MDENKVINIIHSPSTENDRDFVTRVVAYKNLLKRDYLDIYIQATI